MPPQVTCLKRGRVLEAKQFRDLLKKHEEKTLTPQEELLLEKWYESYEADKFKGFKSPAHKAALKDEMWLAVMAVQQQSKTKVIQWHTIYRYAAVITFIVPLLFLGVHRLRKNTLLQHQEQLQSYSTAINENKILTLQDNSTVHLGPSSLIKVSNHFGSLSQRDVILVKGNAFFEVTKDRRHPFIVHTPFLTTRVLGTKFKVSTNLNAYTEVSVSEGKVQVSQARQALALLLPGKKLVFNQRNHEWWKSDFGISENKQWYKTSASFNQATFDQLAGTVKLYYGVNMICKNPQANHYIYNLQIRSERTLDQTIRMICSVHSNHYRRAKDVIVIY